MARSSNSSLVAKLLNQADRLGLSATNGEFPVILKSIVERRRVTDVRFCPLLVDAILTRHSEGFRILLNADSTESEKFERRYRDEATNSLLPARYRFSLAHELAHTLFYDLTSMPPNLDKSLKAGGRKTALEILEQKCNLIAGHILIPEQMLHKAVFGIPRFTPIALKCLAESAGVSAEVLVRRLAESRILLEKHSYFCGCIFVATTVGDETTVQAIASPANRPIARVLQNIKSGEKWQVAGGDGQVISFDNGSEPVEVGFADGRDRSDSIYSMRSERLSAFNGKRSFLVTLERLERF